MRFAAAEREHTARYVLECEEDDDEEGADRRDFATTPAATGVMQTRGNMRCHLACTVFVSGAMPQARRQLLLVLAPIKTFKFVVVGAGAIAKAEPAWRVDVPRHQESTPPDIIDLICSVCWILKYISLEIPLFRSTVAWTTCGGYT